ncbi:uncharacterized protein E5676_scaffold3861G00100 [Cucumis melo var. makuwa]|uniref:Uncharacterized protein n=1 Tax=Cucumis melo var. makuwa TaxID=1194695 RepID=A0A5D3D860_CUCMM|nr:uncharacterized protein E5676_scaffold3861G00100 [Cucumis melo var. makuwa]
MKDTAIEQANDVISMWMNCSGCYEHLSYLLWIKASKRGMESHFKQYRHFQAKCATYLKRKKKSLTSTLSDEETYFVSESESYGGALISCEIEEVPKKASDDQLHAPTVTDTNLQSGTLEESVDNELKFSPSDFEELLYLWKEDLLKQHQERFLTLFKDNHRLMTTISTFKFEHRKVHSEYETLVKSVRMLSPRTQCLDNILLIQKNDRKGLGYLRYQVSFNGKALVFVGASEQQNRDNIPESSNSQTKRKKCKTGGVMFVDSMKENVVGEENIYQPGAPKLNNVCLIQGISTELSSINQLGDQGFRRLRLYLAYLS